MQARLFLRCVPKDPWSEIGLQYLKAFREAGISVRAIGNTLASLQEGSAWEEYAAEFTAPMEDDYINVVCGFGDDFQRCWTAGKVNVAITGAVPREPNGIEVAMLKKYDHVVAVNAAHAEKLLAAGVSCHLVVEPTGLAVKAFFDDLSREANQCP